MFQVYCIYITNLPSNSSNSSYSGKKPVIPQRNIKHFYDYSLWLQWVIDLFYEYDFLYQIDRASVLVPTYSFLIHLFIAIFKGTVDCDISMPPILVRMSSLKNQFDVWLQLKIFSWSEMNLLLHNLINWTLCLVVDVGFVCKDVSISHIFVINQMKQHNFP